MRVRGEETFLHSQDVAILHMHVQNLHATERNELGFDGSDGKNVPQYEDHNDGSEPPPTNHHSVHAQGHRERYTVPDLRRRQRLLHILEETERLGLIGGVAQPRPGPAYQWLILSSIRIGICMLCSSGVCHRPRELATLAS